MSASDATSIRRALLAALDHEPRVNLHRDRIEIDYDDGVAVLSGEVADIAAKRLTLDGEAPSLSHKRLAGVLAWWVPGSRDVINGLGVEPPEDDNDDEILDPLGLVLDKNPLVDATQVVATCTDAAITLRGLVGNDRQKTLIELDAWYLFGVDNVINEIEVVPRGQPISGAGLQKRSSHDPRLSQRDDRPHRERHAARLAPGHRQGPREQNSNDRRHRTAAAARRGRVPHAARPESTHENRGARLEARQDTL